jgi:hypothetical protein
MELDYTGERLDELVGGAVTKLLARRNVGTYSADFVRQAAMTGDSHELLRLTQKFRPEWREAYARYNKVIGVRPNGLAIVVPNVEGVTAVPLAKMGEEGMQALDRSNEVSLRIDARGRRTRGTDKKRKVYHLQSVLSDPDVLTKFGLSDADAQILKRTAVADPVVAAKNLEQLLRHAGHHCVVTPGDYGRGVKAARARLHRALESTYVTPHEVIVQVFGDKAVCEHPHSEGERPQWSVSGPVVATPEIIVVARLAIAQGYTTVRSLFERDLVTCRVTLASEGYDPLAGMEYHVGEQVVGGIGGSDGSGFGFHVRAAATRLLPLAMQGRIVATAVRVTESSAYANWHVLERRDEDNVIYAVGPDYYPRVDIECHHEVAADLWDVRHPSLPLAEGTWLVRDADVGEKAVLVYATAFGCEFSDVVEVRRSETGTVVTTKPPQARAGVSGAALVALDDGALLGVYRGASLEHCSCATISIDYSRPMEVDDARVAASPTTPVDVVWDTLKGRGVASRVEKALDSLQPLYVSGSHVGYAATYGQFLYTTLDGEAWELCDASGKRMGFTRASDMFRVDAPVTTTGLVAVRLPRLQEQAFVVARDAAGGYFSHVTSVARLSSDGRGFWLASDPHQGQTEPLVFAGALVIAESDGYVLGQYDTTVRLASSRMSKCLSLIHKTTKTQLSQEESFNSLAAPHVMVELWEESSVHALMNGDQSVLARFADVGQSAVMAAVLAQNTRDGDVGSRDAAITAVSDSGWVLARAVDCRFAAQVRPVSGLLANVRRAEHSVRTFRAFLGMVVVYQGAEVLHRVLQQWGWFDLKWGEEVRNSAVVPLVELGVGSRTPSPGVPG